MPRTEANDEAGVRDIHQWQTIQDKCIHQRGENDVMKASTVERLDILLDIKALRRVRKHWKPAAALEVSHLVMKPAGKNDCTATYQYYAVLFEKSY